MARRQWLIVLCSGLFCLLAVGHYAWVNAGVVLGLWGPRLACERLQFDCGEVPTDRGVVEHDFIIGNTGWQPLHIKAKTGCGCSTVNLSKEEIAPGDTSTLKVVVNAARLKKGEFKKQVLVKTDDPRSPKVILYLRGKAI